MKSTWRHVVWVVLAVTESAFCLPESATAEGLPQSALVVIVSRSLDGQRAGNGFVVGDGTLVVTAEHLLYEKSEQGGHRVEGFVSVFSPYLGQACDARILASDEELDLAVLEVPWRGHPSLSLADADAVMDARSGRIVGLPAVVKRLDDWDSAASAEDCAAQEEELPVAYVGVRRRVPLFLTLGGASQVGPGWSGSPIVQPGTSVALGCFTLVRSASRYEQTFRREAAGAVASQVPELLGDGFDTSRFRRADLPRKHPQDAHEACSQALRAVSLLQPDKYESALEPAQAFLRLRPDSACGHKMLACASEKLGQTDAARESYRRAVELDPNSLNGRLLYAQFLADNGDPNEAKRVLTPLWQAGRARGLVVIAMVNLLVEQKEHARCIEILEEAVRSEPRNAYLWQQMAGCRAQSQGPAGVIEPLTRVVELRPERGPLRGSLAHALEKIGNLDEAEKHFRTLLDVEPENPVVYFWLAQFLSRHRPEATIEAFLRARKALDLPPRASLPREKIEQLIAELQEREEPDTQP